MPFHGGLQLRSPEGPPSQAELQLMKDLGCEWVRIPVDMAFCLQTDPADLTLAGIDTTGGGAMNSALVAFSLGLKVMVTLTYSDPAWGTQYHEIPKTATQIAGWSRAAAKFVEVNGPIVSAWEIWNEINHGPFNYSPTMATIRPFMKAVVLAMRAEDPNVFIVTSGPASATSYTGQYVNRWDLDANAPALTPTGTTYNTGNGGGSISIATTLDGWFAVDGLVAGNTPGTAWVNAYGCHMYCGTFNPLLQHFGMPSYHAWNDVPNHGTTPYNYWDDIISVRDPGKPLWMTEGGWHGGSADLSEGTAANFAIIQLADWRTKQDEGRAGPFFCFELHDQAIYGASVDVEDYLGMYKLTAGPTYTAKAQQGVWRAFTGATDPEEPPPDPEDPPPVDPPVVLPPPGPTSVSHWGIGVAVEIAFVDNAFTLDSAANGVLDENLLKPDWTWTDVTQYVMRFDTDMGRARGLERFSAGTATVTMNDTVDRRFDPTNTSGAYYPNILPGKPIRIRAENNSVSYNLWFGYIDAWDLTYTQGPSGGGASYVEIRATDGFKLLSGFKTDAVPKQGFDELAGARVHRLLNHADWPGAMRHINAGTANLIATTLEDPVLDELTAVMFSEGGLLYQDGAGSVVFEDRDAATVNTRSRVSQATFGENEIKYADIEVAYDDELIKNDVTLETTPGLRARREDTDSQSTYGTHPFEITGLWNRNEGALGGLADLILALSKDAELRVDTMKLKPQRDPTVMWPEALGRLIHDRVTIIRRPPGGGTMSQECFIEGIKHTAEADGAWETVFSFSSGNTTVFNPLNFVLDNLLIGVLDGVGVLSF